MPLIIICYKLLYQTLPCYQICFAGDEAFTEPLVVAPVVVVVVFIGSIKCRWRLTILSRPQDYFSFSSY